MKLSRKSYLNLTFAICNLTLNLSEYVCQVHIAHKIDNIVHVVVRAFVVLELPERLIIRIIRSFGKPVEKHYRITVAHHKERRLVFAVRIVELHILGAGVVDTGAVFFRNWCNRTKVSSLKKKYITLLFPGRSSHIPSSRCFVMFSPSRVPWSSNSCMY